MSDIFISYASEDRPRVEPLAEALQAQGWSVWWDRVIPAGKSFDEVIEEAVNAARCVVVVWSEKSVSSRWVRTEADEGADRHILVPVLIDEVKIPLAFKRIQAASLIGWQRNLSHRGFDQLVKDITGLIGPPSLARAGEKTPKSQASTYGTPSYQYQPSPGPAPAYPYRQNTAPPAYGSTETEPPIAQGAASHPQVKKRTVGRVSIFFTVVLVVFWVLGMVGHIGGVLIHILLLMSILLIVINIIRWLRRA